MKLFAIALLIPSALSAQTGTIAGRVVARATGEALGYAIVGISGSDKTWFATDSGRFAFRDLTPGRYLVRVKRLGFTPKEVAVDVRSGATDSLVIEMDRVALSLDRVVVAAHPACTAPGVKNSLDTAIAPIVEQLVLNAEELRLMASEYPYRYYLEVRRVHFMKDSLNPSLVDDVEYKRFDSRIRTTYRPGTVLQRQSGKWLFLIPEMQDVADPIFQNAHCWHYAGVTDIDSVKHYRIDVVAADVIRGIDVNASFYINAETFQIRRSVASLAKWPAELSPLTSFVTTVEFKTYLPSIPIIAYILTEQRAIASPRSPIARSLEQQLTYGFEFKDRKPGDPPKP